MLEIWSQWSCGLMISMHKCSSFFTSIALNSIRILKDSTNVSDIEDEKHRFWLYLHMHWKCPITVNGEWNVIQEAVHSYINFHLITCTLYSSNQAALYIGRCKAFQNCFYYTGFYDWIIGIWHVSVHHIKHLKIILSCWAFT